MNQYYAINNRKRAVNITLLENILTYTNIWLHVTVLFFVFLPTLIAYKNLPIFMYIEFYYNLTVIDVQKQTGQSVKWRQNV